MKLGFLGLGRMGSNMVFKLLEHGHEVVVWNRSSEPIESIMYKVLSIKGYEEKIIHNTKYIIHNTGKGSLSAAVSIEDLMKQLPAPRIVWSMLPQGEVTENTLQEIAKYAQKEDIIIDGSNANFNDTQRRYDEFTAKGFRFLGIGVAGGIVGPRAGYCMMAGGDKSAYDYIVPILDSLIQPSAAHGYFGTGGAGHFVKMIHNGVEYGIMQSLAEGFDVLEHAPYTYDLHKIGTVWQKSSLVSGFMLDRAVEALEEDPHLEQLTGNIDATGEAEWMINQAKKEDVPVESIELAFDYRKRSKTDPKIQSSFTARMIAALRNKFGGHKVEKK